MNKTPDESQWKVTQQNTWPVLLKAVKVSYEESREPQEKALVNGSLDGKGP